MDFLDSEYYLQLTLEDKLFAKKIIEKIQVSKRDISIKSTYFLDERQCKFAEDILKAESITGYKFVGGYTNAVRKALIIIPENAWYDRTDKPFSCLEFVFRRQDTLSHRDLLGAIMALGIKREMIGDILVIENKAYVFAINTVCELLLNQLTKIGKVGVKVLQTNFEESFIRDDNFTDIVGTVVSMRLDCIVSLSIKLSREKVSALIKTTGIILNYKNIKSPDTIVNAGDIFSVRGYGKFKLYSIDGITKRNKKRIHIKKFD